MQFISRLWLPLLIVEVHSVRHSLEISPPQALVQKAATSCFINVYALHEENYNKTAGEEELRVVLASYAPESIEYKSDSGNSIRTHLCIEIDPAEQELLGNVCDFFAAYLNGNQPWFAHAAPDHTQCQSTLFAYKDLCFIHVVPSPVSSCEHPRPCLMRFKFVPGADYEEAQRFEDIKEVIGQDFDDPTAMYNDNSDKSVTYMAYKDIWKCPTLVDLIKSNAIPQASHFTISDAVIVDY